jgi:hypothetical protein
MKKGRPTFYCGAGLFSYGTCKPEKTKNLYLLMAVKCYKGRIFLFRFLMRDRIILFANEMPNCNGMINKESCLFKALRLSRIGK